MTNAETMFLLLGDIVKNGANKDGYPNVDGEELMCLTQLIGCPYDYNPLCALRPLLFYEYDIELDLPIENAPNAYPNCDLCKAHWLMERVGE